MPPIIKTDDRIELARHIIEFGNDEESLPEGFEIPESAQLFDLQFPWTDGLAPEPQKITPTPASGAEIPEADVLVITWTVAELEALADVLTPGVNRKKWYPYDRKFNEYKPNIRQGAPSLKANRLGSYYPTKIGNRSIICFKSELHLNQDGVRTGEGTATLPVKDLFIQLIKEVKPKLVITVGTAGATFLEHQLGDVIITRGAKFRLSQEFGAEVFKDQDYRCDTFQIPTQHLEKAQELLKIHAHRLVEPDFGPPTKNYDFPGPLIKAPKNEPDLKIDGVHFAEFHPMLTTDFFEFGNSKNKLELQGSGVEMGDAVLGMVCEEFKNGQHGEEWINKTPEWLVIRNASDPQINGDLQDAPRSLNMQAHWAVWYYETYGYWTSVNSAIAVWAMIAP